VIQRLAIVGVGLLGGSIALAARAHGLAREIVGIGRDRTRLEAPLRAGAVDRVTTDLAAGVRDADVVVLAANVLANEQLLADAWRRSVCPARTGSSGAIRWRARRRAATRWRGRTCFGAPSSS
jgi:prephenate dehydrogenase